MIVTHQNPDWDAIFSVYLIKIVEDLPVRFVNTGNPDRDLLNKAAWVVDTGGGLFDHHHLKGDAAVSTCAAKLVWEYLLREGDLILYLEPLVHQVFLGDIGKNPQSNHDGIHALLSAYKSDIKEREGRFATDEEILEFGLEMAGYIDLYLANGGYSQVFGINEIIEGYLYNPASSPAGATEMRKELQRLLDFRHAQQEIIEDELTDKVVYKSDDERVWAIYNGSVGHSIAAYEQGAWLVVFQSEGIELPGGTTYPIGISRAFEATEPHAGQLVDGVFERIRYSDDPRLQSIAEIIGDGSNEGDFFRHNAGFFAGSGTPKAPVYRDSPPDLDLSVLAFLIDTEWDR